MATQQQLEMARARIAEARIPLTRPEALHLLGDDEALLNRLIVSGRLKGRTRGGLWTTTVGYVLACAATLPEGGSDDGS
jgi:hypothetical protein